MSEKKRRLVLPPLFCSVLGRTRLKGKKEPYCRIVGKPETPLENGAGLRKSQIFCMRVLYFVSVCPGAVQQSKVDRVFAISSTALLWFPRCRSK